MACDRSTYPCPGPKTPPRPDLSIPGEASVWWIVPPHTGLTGSMLPAKPQALDWGPMRARDFNRSVSPRSFGKQSWTS